MVDRMSTVPVAESPSPNAGARAGLMQHLACAELLKAYDYAHLADVDIGNSR